MLNWKEKLRTEPILVLVRKNTLAERFLLTAEGALMHDASLWPLLTGQPPSAARGWGYLYGVLDRHLVAWFRFLDGVIEARQPDAFMRTIRLSDGRLADMTVYLCPVVERGHLSRIEGITFLNPH